MLAHSALDALPSADAWLTLPDPPPAISPRRRERAATLAARRHVRYLYFDLGAGMIKRLASDADQDAVRAAQRSAYDNYRHRCVVELRSPLRYLQYLRCWRAWNRRVWLRHDVPRAARERLGMVS